MHQAWILQLLYRGGLTISISGGSQPLGLQFELTETAGSRPLHAAVRLF
jgi:hypothetical protein